MKVLVLVDFLQDKLNNISSSYEVVYMKRADVTKEIVKDFDVIVGNIDPSLLTDDCKCQLLQLESAGNDRYLNIPSHITLCNASGSFGWAIAEYVIGQVLAWRRKFYQYYDAQKAGFWQKRLGASGIYGSTFVILGCGDLGTHIAKYAKALGAKTIGVRKNAHRQADYFDEIYGNEAFMEVLKDGDVVVNTLPHTLDSMHLLTDKHFDVMKESAIFVNVGRGSVVSLDVLTNALVAKKIEAALLDVYEVEPLPQEHPLWKLDNVIMTPHISGTFEIEESRKRFIDLVISNLKSLENKETLQNIVNKQAQY